MQGTVKWFNDAKGFGFIEHDSGRDVFVHYSVIETEGFKTLKDGEIVFYSLAEGDKGLHAGRVVRDPSVVKAAKPKTVPIGGGAIGSETIDSETIGIQSSTTEDGSALSSLLEVSRSENSNADSDLDSAQENLGQNEMPTIIEKATLASSGASAGDKK